MKSTLKLTNPLWQTPKRRLMLDRAVQRSGAELESRIKQKILTGPKTGRVYRRGAIKKKVAPRDLKFYRSDRRIFRRTFTSLTNEKTTVGYQFHRASAPGEAPANSTGELANSIRATKLGFMSVRVATSKRYALALDNGAVISGRNKRTRIAGPMRNRVIQKRPFFEVTAIEYKPIFKQNILEAIRGNS